MISGHANYAADAVKSPLSTPYAITDSCRKSTAHAFEAPSLRRRHLALMTVDVSHLAVDDKRSVELGKS